VLVNGGKGLRYRVLEFGNLEARGRLGVQYAVYHHTRLGSEPLYQYMGSATDQSKTIQRCLLRQCKLTPELNVVRGNRISMPERAVELT